MHKTPLEWSNQQSITGHLSLGNLSPVPWGSEESEADWKKHKNKETHRKKQRNQDTEEELEVVPKTKLVSTLYAFIYLSSYSTSVY